MEKAEDMTTGEEGETKVHQVSRLLAMVRTSLFNRCFVQVRLKLYCLDTNGKTSEWKERGVGLCSVNDYTDKDGSAMSRLGLWHQCIRDGCPDLAIAGSHAS